MFIYMNKAVLPGNSSTRDDVEFNEKVTRPIGLVLKRPPRLLEFTPSTPPARSEEPKEMSASDFPKLRGFA
jgi:hypothetical protein